LDWKGQNITEQEQTKNSHFYIFSRKFSPLYNYESVILMRPISSETKDDLRKGKNDTQEWERLSEKHLSYFNLLSVSTSLDKNHVMTSIKPHHYKFNISKINANKTLGNELVIYNTLKDSWQTIFLDNFRQMKNPCKHHTLGLKSGYYFIYDNQGIIHVIYENLQICELSLIDMRQDPTLFVYEKNVDQSILFVAGGYHMRNNGIAICDNIAIFYLNFKELSKLLKHEPLYFIKMKYPRMNPTIIKYKKENELVFLVMGGNDINKIQSHSKDSSRKSFQFLLDDANLFCEIISFKRIKDNIFKSDFTQTHTIATEDSLLIMANGITLEENKNENLRFHLDEAAFIELKIKKSCKKLSYLIGVGKKKNEIWLIDQLDFVEHKIFMFKSRQTLIQQKNNYFCKAMITLMGNDMFYFNIGSNDLKFKKLHFKSNFSLPHVNVCATSECNIF